MYRSHQVSPLRMSMYLLYPHPSNQIHIHNKNMLFCLNMNYESNIDLLGKYMYLHNMHIYSYYKDIPYVNNIFHCCMNMMNIHNMHKLICLSMLYVNNIFRCCMNMLHFHNKHKLIYLNTHYENNIFRYYKYMLHIHSNHKHLYYKNMLY